jgi:hypothetical protein
MVLGHFAKPKGPRLPGRNPASTVYPNNFQFVKYGCTASIFSLPNKAGVYWNDYRRPTGSSLPKENGAKRERVAYAGSS